MTSTPACLFFDSIGQQRTLLTAFNLRQVFARALPGFYVVGYGVCSILGTSGPLLFDRR
jgi:hypothetical protein